jgi:hypothetical protein
VTSRDRFSFLSGWILVCTYLSAAGWVLSLFGALTPAGYLVVLFAGGLGLLFLRSRFRAPARGWLALSKLRWRARQSLPALYFLYASLTFVSGLLYAPTNFDALSYRLPRVLHWLAEHRWHWIATSNPRLNVSATAFDWLTAPVLALARTDRWLFLINTLCYLLLPGLLFAVLARLGVKKRVAWYWMWLLPTGYCFALQAGGIGNDLFSTVYGLAAIHYGLKARESGQIQDLWLGILAAALLTGAKATNLPLLLPCALALWPSLNLIRKQMATSIAVVALAVAASFLPTALENARFTGSWGGDPHNQVQVQLESPVYGVIGNSLQLLVGNGMPPVMPFIKQWNRFVEKEKQTAFFERLVRHFPRFRLDGTNELPQEEGAGIGLGLSGLLVITGLAAWQGRKPAQARGGPNAKQRTGIFVCLGAWVALLAYMAKMGSEAGPRLLAPYYPLLFATFLLLPGTETLVRRPWWRLVALVAALSVLPALILSPARPLWPAQSVCHHLRQRFPNQALLERATTIYDVYRTRDDNLAPLRLYIPSACLEVGLIAGGDDPETSLWRPFGARKVLEVTPANQAEVLGGRVTTVVVNKQALELAFGCSVAQWLSEKHLRMLGQEKLRLQVKGGWQDWLVVQGEPKR